MFGYGNSQYAASHGRPVWKIGKMAAQATAKTVIASAARLIDVRQCCRNSIRMAEISVPAWPMPIHQTKLMIAKPQPTGLLTPQMPVPLNSRYVSATSNSCRMAKPIKNPMNQLKGVRPVMIPVILSEIDPKLCPGAR